MDRPSHDYSAAAAAAAAAAMAFAQQQQQQYGFHPQIQQFPSSVHGPPFLPPHPSLQQYPFSHQQPPPQPLHPHPHLLHLQQQQPPPPNFPPHIPPQLVNAPYGSGGPGPGPYESAPPPVTPPPDPELHKRIDKLSEYVAKNGPEFEAMVRDREGENPQYSFLFGGEGHGYYRYKLWICARPPGPFNPSYPSSISVMHGAQNPMLSPHGPPLNPAVAQQPSFPPLYDQQHHQYMGHGRTDFEHTSRTFTGIHGPLPSDVAIELNNVLGSLSGTKESIKGAKMWFMQRSPFGPSLAEALRERIFAVDDSEKQLHIIYLVNDILFDSLQRRANPLDLDNEALAFKPFLGSMLARIYHNSHNKDENQSRLQKILQFWATKEVYDQETIHAFEAEMLGGPPAFPLPGPPKELRSSSFDPSAVGGMPSIAQQLHQDKLNNLTHKDQPDRNGIPLTAMQPGIQFAYPPFISSLPLSSAGVPSIQQPGPINVAEKLPPYPLFPPGLIPGMVRKQQIGSGVPYSPMSPLDIPTAIPPSEIPESDLLESVSKFFKEIGEVNPSEGPMNSSEGRYEDEYERDSPVRKGGACIPPPPNLQAADPDTGANADGSVKVSSGGYGRLGLGATADPNEPSQYDDVYSSYRKQRSSNYHTSMSVRAVTR